MKNNNQRLVIYTDGSGDGRFCYYKPVTREIGRRQIEGLTNNGISKVPALEKSSMIFMQLLQINN